MEIPRIDVVNVIESITKDTNYAHEKFEQSGRKITVTIQQQCGLVENFSNVKKRHKWLVLRPICHRRRNHRLPKHQFTRGTAKTQQLFQVKNIGRV